MQQLSQHNIRLIKTTSNILLIYGVIVFLYSVLYFFLNLRAVVWTSFWIYQYFFFVGLLFHMGITFILILGSFMLFHIKKLLLENNVLGCTGGIFGLAIIAIPMLITFPATFDALEEFLYDFGFRGFSRVFFLVWIFFNLIMFYLLLSLKVTLKTKK